MQTNSYNFGERIHKFNTFASLSLSTPSLRIIGIHFTYLCLKATLTYRLQFKIVFCSRSKTSYFISYSIW